MKKLVLFSTFFLSLSAAAQEKISAATYQKALKLADSVSISNGKLKLYNIFKLQVKTIYENQHKPPAVFKKAVLEKTYLPFRNFWSGYVGDSSVYFDEIIVPLLKDSITLLERKTGLFADGRIDTYFKKMAGRLQQTTGYYPKGTWYLAFGSGVTDMGGFGGGTMVLDLTHYKTTLAYTTFILPHELTHQVFDLTNKEDSSAKGLYRVINEGLAVFMNEKLLGPAHTLREYLQYSEQELRYCQENESTIVSKLKPFLFTGNPDHALALADRGQKVFKDGPGAIGYFIGYRMCKAYVEKNGKESWKDIFTSPVKETWQKSGYGQ